MSPQAPTTGLPRLIDLPNEILVSILTLFLTTELLQLALTCRRFHALVVRILHSRLVVAPSLPEYKLILEAYHPSSRTFDPHLFCTYLRTDELLVRHNDSDGRTESRLQVDPSNYNEIDSLSRLKVLYSRFRPERPDVAATMPLRRNAGAAPRQAQDGSTVQPIYRNAGDGGSARILHLIHLDSDELFGQFCVYSSLVRLGPRRGVFLRTVPIVKPKQGTMRVWKTWLCERARESRRGRKAMTTMVVVGKGGARPTQTETTENGPVTVPYLARAGQGDGNTNHADADADAADTGDDDLVNGANDADTIMWTDDRKNVGIRVAVSCREQICYDEFADLDAVPLSFTLEIQELVVRTTHLMLAAEASTSESENRAARAFIFGNFATVRSDIIGPAATDAAAVAVAVAASTGT